MGIRHSRYGTSQIHAAVFSEDPDKEVSDTDDAGGFKRRKIQIHAGYDEKHGEDGRRKPIYLPEQLLIFRQINIRSAEYHAGKQRGEIKGGAQP